MNTATIIVEDEDTAEQDGVTYSTISANQSGCLVTRNLGTGAVEISAAATLDRNDWYMGEHRTHEVLALAHLSECSEVGAWSDVTCYEATR